MIKVDNRIVEVGHFPDGTQMLLNFEVEVRQDVPITITWCYEYEEEALTVMYLKRHLENQYSNEIYLMMPYVANSRMDRVKNDGEVFTLKYFCEFINYLKFDKVIIVDPHSIVTEALINNLKVLRPDYIISMAIDYMLLDNSYKREVICYFPDDGAFKRYKDLECLTERKCIYGKKERDWKTGKILDIKVCDANGEVLPTCALNGVDVLMIDDIISYGGTLAYSADKLKELGTVNICAYATHVENSVLDSEKGTLIKRINNGIVDKVYTTNSLFHEEHPNFDIIHKF